ncbi:MAG: response regulator [Nitrospinae bacterium]|nr:response regulator [Nitrospinota bacterium]
MKYKILIVDDEESIVNALTRYLSLYDYDVVGVTSPEEALALVKKDNIMVVISDIMMPGMSGIELLAEIKEFNGMVQVIMATGVVKIENVLECLRLGANHCFLKPLDDLSLVKDAVDEAIGRLARWEELIRSMVKRKG